MLLAPQVRKNGAEPASVLLTPSSCRLPTTLLAGTLTQEVSTSQTALAPAPVPTTPTPVSQCLPQPRTATRLPTRLQVLCRSWGWAWGRLWSQGWLVVTILVTPITISTTPRVTMPTIR